MLRIAADTVERSKLTEVTEDKEEQVESSSDGVAERDRLYAELAECGT